MTIQQNTWLRFHVNAGHIDVAVINVQNTCNGGIYRDISVATVIWEVDCVISLAQSSC